MHEGQARLIEPDTVGNSNRKSELSKTADTGLCAPNTDGNQTGSPCALHSDKNSAFSIELAEWIKQVYLARPESTPDYVQNGAGNKDMQRRFDIQENIAKRIAQDLHDDASQMLAVVRLKLASVARDCSKPTALKLDSVSRQLDEVCEHIRRLSHELRPIALECSGLKPALKLLAESARKRFNVDVTISGNLPGTPSQVEINLYRIVQEALSNVYRHANANHVDIQLRLDDQAFHCTISDNGSGIKRQDFGRNGGLGLIGILERVNSMGGSCKLTSRLDKGLSLAVEVPR